MSELFFAYGKTYERYNVESVARLPQKSAGCLNCYVYFLDGRRDKDANVVTRSKTNFYLPLAKDRTGKYKISGGKEIPTCFTSDFLSKKRTSGVKKRGRLFADVRI